jgi:signal transduction histidine kinase
VALALVACFGAVRVARCEPTATQASSTLVPTTPHEMEVLDPNDDNVEEIYPFQFQLEADRRHMSFLERKIAHLEKRLASRPDNIGLQVKLGRAKYYVVLNRHIEYIPQARAIFEGILAKKPDHAVALAYHGSLILWTEYMAVGDDNKNQASIDHGLAEMSRAVALAPDDLEVRLMRAFTLSYSPLSPRERWPAVDDFTHAIDLMQKIGIAAGVPGIRLQLGDVYFALGRLSEAHEQWQWVLDHGQDAGERQAAQVRLQYRQGLSRAQRVSWRDLLSLLALLVGIAGLGIVAAQPLRGRSWRRGWIAGLALLLGVAGVAALAVLLAQMVGGAGHLPLTLGGGTLLGIAAGVFASSLLLLRWTREPLADALLKRGVVAALFAVAMVALFQYVLAPVSWKMLAAGAGALFTVLVAAVWTGLAVSFPFVQRGVSRFVDRRLFHREESTRFLAELGSGLAAVTSEAQLFDLVCSRLQEYLRVRFVRCVRLDETGQGGSEPPEEVRAGLREFEKRHPGTLARVEEGDPWLAPAERLWGRVARVLLLRPKEGGVVAALVGGGHTILSGEDEVLDLVGPQLASTLENLRLHDSVRERAVAQESLARLATQAELRALRAQIHPHFLFNTLNSIAGLIQIEPRRAEELVEELAELLRYRFRAGREFIPLSEELSLVNSYLKIEQVRLGTRLVVKRDVEPAALAVPVPPLLLQPLVENAVTHGVARKVEGGEVRLVARVHGERLELRVEDDGDGMPQSPEVEAAQGARVTDVSVETADETSRPSPSYGSNGVGLANVLARLQRIYGDGAHAEVRSQAGRGTRIVLDLPLVPPQPHEFGAATGGAK